MFKNKLLCKIFLNKINSNNSEYLIGEISENQLFSESLNFSNFITIKNKNEETIFKGDIDKILIYRNPISLCFDKNDLKLNYSILNTKKDLGES